MTKTASPTSYNAPGIAITYTYIVRNTGNSTLTTIPLTDTYEANYLQFLSADPAPNSNTMAASR